MTTYISILRGINVSGHNIIKMDALKKMYEALGFHNARSYVQSGNVAFECVETDVRELANKITEEIAKQFGYQVPVIVFTKGVLENIIDKNILAKDGSKDTKFLHVTFLADKPVGYDSKAIEDKMFADEEVHFSDEAVYIYIPGGYGDTKLSNAFLENKLKVKATTRNWKTTNELLKLADK